jgi:hypothetical protein
MDIITALGGIGAAFGLSTSAGLNAYIPLLIVSVVARFTDLINLGAPYDTLESYWVMGLLVVLLLIEMLVDKVPAVDTINDVIQTLIRPAAGALLFAANANVVTDVSPVLAIIAGILLAGTVHATKSVARPAITASTVGTGNWLVSIVEDIIAFVMSILSVIIAPLMFFVSIGFLFWIVRLFVRRRRKTNELAFE